MISATPMGKTAIHKVITTFIIIMILFLVGCKSPIDYFADQMIYPERQQLPKTPANYDLNYQDVVIESTNGIKLKAWLIPAESDKLILLTHPMGFTRYGYTVTGKHRVDTKVEVEFLKTVRQLHHAGYTVLMFDFRNHGESDPSQDGITGAGLNEYLDVVAAVKYIKSDPALREKKIGILAHCMGANSAIIAFSKAPDVMRDIKCIIAEQPVNMALFYQFYTKDIYGSLFAKSLPMVEKKCIQKGGYPWHEMSSLSYAKDISAPTLYVQAETDPWIDTQFVVSVYNATPSPKEIFWLKGKMARFDTYNYFGEHPEKMLEFLKKYM
jgi:uncharacterized protein